MMDFPNAFVHDATVCTRKDSDNEEISLDDDDDRRVSKI